ncbi:MAG: adenovirus L4-33K/L4-22K family protein [Acidobacteriota bacterium]
MAQSESGRILLKGPSGLSTRRAEYNGAIRLLLCWLAAGLALTNAQASDSTSSCIVINGLGGMPEYEETFLKWSGQVGELFRKSKSRVYSLDGGVQERDQILQVFREVARSAPSNSSVWLFLVGHANYDGSHYKFHIRGPDLTDDDLKHFLDSFKTQKVQVIAATSASGALLPVLKGANRVVVTATRNSQERQPPLFMSFFLQAVNSAQADTDKNGKVSLLEAFLSSRKQVADWFKSKGRLQTEHAVLDDHAEVRLSADKKSSEAVLAPGLLSSLAYLSTPPETAYRSLEAKALAGEKATLEREIEALKFRKKELAEADYYQKLEQLLIKLAQLNEKMAKLEVGK